jgi:hypothetical protein
LSEPTANLILQPEIITAPLVTPTPHNWSPFTRLAFRFSFSYFILYALCSGNGTIWGSLLAGANDYVGDWLAWPFQYVAQWLGQHWLHLSGVAATLHPSDSGDTALNWVDCGIMLFVALVSTVLWTTFDRRRTAYPILFAWFRFTIRLTLGIAMLNYGTSKLFPMQIPLPSLAILNEPVGSMAPMALLWTLIGLNPGYEIVCGVAEITAGLLILYRRTALLGALFAAFIVSNVVFYNFFFDVPVKLYATHLLLMALVVSAPDFRSLYSYFWQHQPIAPRGAWVPPAKRHNFRIATTVVEIAIVVMGFGYQSYESWHAYEVERVNARNPSSFVGQWHINSALLGGQPKPLLNGDGLPMTDIYIEPTGRVMLRDTVSALWSGYATFDHVRQTVKLETNFRDALVYSIQQPDALHLVLTPIGDDIKTNGILMLTHVSLPTHYPLLDSGFHFVNEWSLQR